MYVVLLALMLNGCSDYHLVTSHVHKSKDRAIWDGMCVAYVCEGGDPALSSRSTMPIHIERAVFHPFLRMAATT